MPDERREAIQELVAGWMRRARSDLTLAHMTEDERIAPEILAFHAQQAAEKALKALLVQRQVEFPPVHVIGLLLNLCQAAGYKGTEALADAVTLTRYAVATRYLGEEEPVGRQEAREAAELTARVLAWWRRRSRKSHSSSSLAPLSLIPSISYCIFSRYMI